MALGEDYLKLLMQIGNFTKKVTGISIVDAYFGPKKLSPEKRARRLLTSSATWKTAFLRI
ncbi:MAG: hypothetical protein ABSG57_00515 [Candidatus Bathyarchaeia archaeon]|jgi:hypothetical protein